ALDDAGRGAEGNPGRVAAVQGGQGEDGLAVVQAGHELPDRVAGGQRGRLAGARGQRRDLDDADPDHPARAGDRADRGPGGGRDGASDQVGRARPLRDAGRRGGGGLHSFGITVEFYRDPGQQAGRRQHHQARVVADLKRDSGGHRRAGLHQHRAARGAELLRDVGHLTSDDILEPIGVFEDLGQRGDLGPQRLLLPLQLQLVEAGEAAQRGIEDVLGLDLGQVENLAQALLGGGGVVAGADDLDDLVDVEQRDEDAVDQVQPVLPLAAAELAAAPDDVDAVLDVDAEQVLEAEGARLAVDEGDVVDAERLLHRRQPVQLGEDGLRVEAGPDLDDQVQAAVAVGEVLEVGDAGDLLRLDEVLDPGDDLFRADAVGQLGDDDAGLARVQLLDLGGGAGLEYAPAGLVGLPDAVEAGDVAAGRQVRARDVLHQLRERRVRVLQQVAGGGDDLGEVVRRHVGGHAHGDPGRAVDQEVRDRRGQYLRLLLAPVVVGAEVDGLLVDALDHGHRGLGRAALGVPHRGGGVVAAEAAEVAVPVHQRQAHGPGLGQPHQGVVDRAVAVRVQAAHDVADHAGALDVARGGPQAHLVHLEQDAPLDRLQAVAGVRERAGVDDAVGVLQVGAAHLLGDVDIDDVLFDVFGRRRCRAAAAWWHAAVLGASWVTASLGNWGLGVNAGQVELGGAADDEVTARGDLGAHEQVEHVSSGLGVLDPNPPQGTVARVHGRLGQLVRVHLAQALVSLGFLPALALALQLNQRAAQLGVGVGVQVLRLALARVGQLDAVQRRDGGEHPARVEQRAHVAVEQREQQRADVRAVDVRVRHEDDPL